MKLTKKSKIVLRILLVLALLYFCLVAYIDYLDRQIRFLGEKTFEVVSNESDSTKNFYTIEFYQSNEVMGSRQFVRYTLRTLDDILIDKMYLTITYDFGREDADDFLISIDSNRVINIIFWDGEVLETIDLKDFGK
jgi:hypothetical protein